MANSLASTATLSPVEFAGATLYVVDHEGKPFAPMKAIVEAMGLDWASQFTKLKANTARWGIVEIAIPSSGGIQTMICIALYKLAGWLTSISPNKVKDLAVRERVVKYQNECDTALWDYWTIGHAVRPTALPQSITPSQAQHLRELVALVVESGKQGHGETWARLHRKLKVNSYLALHPDQFDAACKYLRTKMDDASIAAIAQKHFPQIAQLSAPTPEPQPMPPKVPPEMLIGLITGGCLSLAVVRDIAMAATSALYRKACMSPSGYGEEVSRKITKDLPLADLHAIVVRATMEMELRVHGYDIAQREAA